MTTRTSATHTSDTRATRATPIHVSTSVDTSAITLHAHAARAAIQIARTKDRQAKRAEQTAYNCARACATAARRLGVIDQDARRDQTREGE